MIIKVCGMRDPQNMRAVELSGPDWMGFIFYPPSPRFVERYTGYLPESAARVGVFVNERTERILATARTYALEFVQLHGSEPAGYCRELKEKGLRIIKVFSVKEEKDLAAAAGYEDCCDYFLFDTPCRGFGGSGRRFDWRILSAYGGGVPFLLSGGLHPGCLPALQELRHPRWAGIDLNSGFESAPGVKDAPAVGKFIKECRRLFG